MSRESIQGYHKICVQCRSCSTCQKLECPKTACLMVARVQQAAQEAQRRTAEANARSARNPFFAGGSFFRQRPPPGPSQPRKYDDPQGSGPIIDVSYESLD